MPLAFPSRSHGTVAFGFFNIEIDMLLLERYFFFAHHFCAAVVALAEESRAGGDRAVSLPGFEIADPRQTGNVNAAIQCWDLSGFIGATYRRFPFPSDPAGFKQQPDRAHNRSFAEQTVRGFGVERDLQLAWRVDTGTVAIAEIEFTRLAFAGLIAYVDRGGYPRWQDEVRPTYVDRMNAELARAPAPAIAYPAAAR